MIRSLLPALVSAAFLGIGAGAAVAPEMLAENFGIPIDDDAGRAYVRGLGARDAVVGILIAAFLASANRPALATTLCVSSLLGLSDFITVFRARGSDALGSLTIHATGTLGLVAIGAFVASEPGP